jgi:DNA-binding MarR family transcriptional regulator
MPEVRAAPAGALSAPAPRGCTSLKLRQLTRRVSRDYDALIGAATGLKTTQYSLLGHLAALGPVRPADLAARLLLEPSTLTRNLQPLIAQGWVRNEPGADRRSRLIVLTDAGRAQHAAARHAWKAAQAALTVRLGPDRVAALHALLDECLAVLATSDAAPEPSELARGAR